MVNLTQNVKEEQENIFRYMSIQYTVKFDRKHDAPISVKPQGGEGGLPTGN